MNTLYEVCRAAYPRHLRFDKASQILYAECYTLAKRNRSKKYLAKSDIQHILDGYATLPGAPVLQLPIIRHVLLIRQINSFRVYYGGKFWLYTRGVDTEYHKVKSWLEAQRTAATTSKTKGARTAAQASREAKVERERFEQEVLRNMKVATMYQRGIRWSFFTIAALILLVLVSIYTDWCVYLWLKFGKQMPREEVLAWFRHITLQHVTTEVPSAYQHLLPPPCALYKNAKGETNVAVNIVELVDVERNLTVLAIPSPQMGERRFYDEVGELVRECDSVMLEAVTFEKIDKIVPAYFFPLKENTFPVLGVHHRYLDILRHSQSEPPKLHPAGTACGWKAYIQQVLIPFEVRCVYVPDVLSATKAEARVGWGRLRDAVDRLATEQAEAGPGTPPLIIALPWTVQHIVNLEASLVKYGFKVNKVFPLHWLAEDQIGNNFCNYFQY